MIRVRDLHKDHPLVLAAHKMVEAHEKHETLLPAIAEVREQFPELEEQTLIVLWVAINAKDLDSN